MTYNHQFTIPDRTLVRRGSKPGEPATTSLEAVRDYLTKLAEAQDPVDHDRSLDQLHISFQEGSMTGQFLAHDGLSREILRVSRNGASQLAKEVLPSRFFAGLTELAGLDESGAKLAGVVWNKFGRDKEKVRMIRTVRMRLDGDVHRVIRSCHSQDYAPYSNLEFAQALLDYSKDFAELPVMDWRVTDSVMRLRFLAIDEPLAVLRHWDEGALMSEPVPMIEVWNSEVGRRRVVLRGGMWRMVCANGMGHWDQRRDWNWIHRGASERIQQGVRSAYQDILTTANGVVDAYNQALEVAIDDACAWMEKELRPMDASTTKLITEAQKNLADPTTTPGGSLASVVDAITLTAQREGDVFQQYEVERMGANVLRKGLAQALKSSDRSITFHP